MELEGIKKELIKIGSNLSGNINQVEFFLFGSILTDPKKANDIDILILYESSSQIDLIRKEFKVLEEDYPTHLTYFTFSEENEFNFVKQVKAVKIFSI